MARVEADREDLFTEIVALVRRIEFASNASMPEIVIGFRQSGWLSVYFGQDLMFQFDAIGRLRRAYSNGFLYRSHGTLLAKLHRHRTDVETSLLRYDLTAEELGEFRYGTLVKIRQLAHLLESNTLTVQRKVPADDDELTRDVTRFLSDVLQCSEFLSPAIRVKP